jgi:hypothetical protein
MNSDLVKYRAGDLISRFGRRTSIHLELAVPSIGSTQSTGCFFSDAKTPNESPPAGKSINATANKDTDLPDISFSFQFNRTYSSIVWKEGIRQANKECS